MTSIQDDRVLDKIRMDVRVWSDLWSIPPGPLLWLRLFMLEPGFQVAFSIRLQEALGSVPIVGKALRRLLWYFGTVWHGCDIGPSARIGGGIFLPHPIGIVIGGDCTIGRHVQINQHVTIGNLGALQGANTDSRASPTIGDGAIIFSGAVVAGGLTIGRGAFVGANAVVRKDVPAGYTAVGVPARLIAPRQTSAASEAANGPGTGEGVK